jgi:hypothetical protein
VGVRNPSKVDPTNRDWVCRRTPQSDIQRDRVGLVQCSNRLTATGQSKRMVPWDADASVEARENSTDDTRSLFR